MLKKRQWGRYIRLVSTDDAKPIAKRKRSKRKETMQADAKKDAKRGDWSPPSIISFVPDLFGEDADNSSMNFW